MTRRLWSLFKVGPQPSPIDNHNSMTLTFISMSPQRVTSSRNRSTNKYAANLQPWSYSEQQPDTFTILSRDTRAAGSLTELIQTVRYLKFVQLPPHSVGLHTYPAGMWLYCSWGAVRLVATSTQLIASHPSELSEWVWGCVCVFFFFPFPSI